jgi:hypothetical protein
VTAVESDSHKFVVPRGASLDSDGGDLALSDDKGVGVGSEGDLHNSADCQRSRVEEFEQRVVEADGELVGQVD